MAKTTCGFCRTNDHIKCVGRYQRWVAEYKTEKRVKKFVVIYLDDYNECSCTCEYPKEG